MSDIELIGEILAQITEAAINGLIAATGITYDFVVVTRNTQDIKISGVTLLNP